MLKKGTADALLVVKLDRLTRSVADLGELSDRLHFLSLQELLFEVFGFGDVMNDGENARLVIQVNSLSGDFDQAEFS